MAYYLKILYRFIYASHKYVLKFTYKRKNEPKDTFNGNERIPNVSTAISYNFLLGRCLFFWLVPGQVNIDWLLFDRQLRALIKKQRKIDQKWSFEVPFIDLELWKIV